MTRHSDYGMHDRGAVPPLPSLNEGFLCCCCFFNWLAFINCCYYHELYVRLFLLSESCWGKWENMPNGILFWVTGFLTQDVPKTSACLMAHPSSKWLSNVFKAKRPHG